MAIEIKMPALSPTMEEGTLAKWLVREGDAVRPGDILAEIETDKATMEFEASDEGVVSQILIAEGTDGIMVGATIALLLRDAEAPARTNDVTRGDTVPAKPRSDLAVTSSEAAEHGDDGPLVENTTTRPRSTPGAAAGVLPDVSPLARRIIEQQGIDVARVKGSGPAGRVIRADLAPERQPVILAAAAPTPAKVGPPEGVPFETVELSVMRRTTARQLTESKRQVPHIYLTVDVALDALLTLRGTLNRELDDRGIRLSVNDMLIKAQGAALMEVPSCNVQFTDDALIRFGRADIAVAVSIPGGLITPIVTSADGRSLSAIAAAMADLASRARDGNLQPAEYQGGTAGLSNMGMYGMKQFAATINPPQAMILAVGAGERQVRVVDGEPAVATVMSVTGSFDHRAIDGADGAAFMTAFKRLVENPLTLFA